MEQAIWKSCHSGGLYGFQWIKQSHLNLIIPLSVSAPKRAGEKLSSIQILQLNHFVNPAFKHGWQN